MKSVMFELGLDDFQGFCGFRLVELGNELLAGKGFVKPI